jgi:hypothetical protein
MRVRWTRHGKVDENGAVHFQLLSSNGIIIIIFLILRVNQGGICNGLVTLVSWYYTVNRITCVDVWKFSRDRVNDWHRIHSIIAYINLNIVSSINTIN